MNEVSRKILEQVNSVIIGKEAVTEKVLMAVLAQGHVLLEDVPGVGKTTMALAFSKALGLDLEPGCVDILAETLLPDAAAVDAELSIGVPGTR